MRDWSDYKYVFLYYQTSVNQVTYMNLRQDSHLVLEINEFTIESNGAMNKCFIPEKAISSLHIKRRQ